MARKQVGAAPSGATDAATKALVDAANPFAITNPAFDPAGGLYLETGRMIMNDGAAPTMVGLPAVTLAGSTVAGNFTPTRSDTQRANRFKGHNYSAPSAAVNAVASIGVDLGSPNRLYSEIALRFRLAVTAAIAESRFAAGFKNGGSFGTIDSEPSNAVDWMGIGWDTADSNIQIITANGGGSAKIDTGIPFVLGGAYQILDMLIIGTAANPDGFRYLLRVNQGGTITTVDGTSPGLTSFVSTNSLNFAAKASSGGVSSTPNIRMMGLAFGAGRMPGGV